MKKVVIYGDCLAQVADIEISIQGGQSRSVSLEEAAVLLASGGEIDVAFRMCRCTFCMGDGWGSQTSPPTQANPRPSEKLLDELERQLGRRPRVM